ncbi:MAG: SDR family NAD(P)-dependent oxidoreductase [Phycisphaeraceae bacterium]|nr:SDR family NAD(P)-dependent oxidoreductase [Phycisphaeraceae bacterium]
MKSVMVTGAAGFIGSHVVEALLERGARVVGVDNFDTMYERALKERNIAQAVSRGATLVEADITDAGTMRELMQRHAPETVVHLAAKAGVRPSQRDPAGYAHTNVTGTAVVLAEGAKAGVKRCVVASSSSVYGNNETLPFSETDRIDRPISPYAATKVATEALCFTHWHAHQTPTACLRFFTVYGPRQRPDLAIRKFMRWISAGEPIEFYGDGSASRDYTFIDDIVAGVLAAIERIDDHGYRVWNLGSDAPVTLRELVRAIERTVGREAQLDRKPAQVGDVERTWADLKRAREELAYAPTTDLLTGLAKQWAWMRAED